METNKRFAMLLLSLYEELLEEGNLEAALAGSLEILVNTLKSEAGTIWLLDRSTDRLVPMFHQGPADLSNFSVELGPGAESYVTRTGESLCLNRPAEDPRFSGTLLEENGLPVRSMICVPLNDLHAVVGCLQIVNKRDGGDFTPDELRLCERMAALAALTISEKGLAVNAGDRKDVLIRLRGVIKEFPSGEGVLRVLKGIDLDIYKGEFLVVLGESGCGKSTLVNIIGGMDFLTDGQLLVGGKDYSQPSDDELTRFRREYLGFVFQSYNLMPNLTAQENVQFIADIAKDPMSAAEAIRLVGLESKADNYPSTLSGGQQQRVAIARAIVKNPQIVFADEPTAALDYQTSVEVLSVFEKIMEQRGTTVVMITHNPEIAKMANRVVKLKGGLVSSVKVNLHPLRAEELVW
ncbi:MAG: ATP-binding cassette domain-containing protein [Oscillospiraceae bacterium]|nr:ATP-binding cassette domain-containing protein [Oscillospiraceae bacterium]